MQKMLANWSVVIWCDGCQQWLPAAWVMRLGHFPASPPVYLN